MKAKILVFVICAEAIIYLLLYNLHDCTFNKTETFTARFFEKKNTRTNFQQVLYTVFGLMFLLSGHPLTLRKSE